jgi:hypothetical protein
MDYTTGRPDEAPVQQTAAATAIDMLPGSTAGTRIRIRSGCRRVTHQCPTGRRTPLCNRPTGRRGSRQQARAVEIEQDDAAHEQPIAGGEARNSAR